MGSRAAMTGDVHIFGCMNVGGRNHGTRVTLTFVFLPFFFFLLPSNDFLFILLLGAPGDESMLCMI